MADGPSASRASRRGVDRRRLARELFDHTAREEAVNYHVRERRRRRVLAPQLRRANQSARPPEALRWSHKIPGCSHSLESLEKSNTHWLARALPLV